MSRTIVVTGCDSAHYDLVTDLLTSLTDAGREGLTVGFIHVGDDAVPAEIEAAVDCMVHVPDDGFHANGVRGYRLAYLGIKPRLPDLFPGYETYVWLDGDTWVQNRAGIDQIVQSAQFAAVCAHPELDPNYFRIPLRSERLLTLYGPLYGEADAASHVSLPMFNSGVFAGTAGSPLWALWSAALAEVHDKILASARLYFSDQVPMHHLIASLSLSVQPLRAVNNWLMHAAAPALNLKTRRVVAPTYPYEEINILHLSGETKDVKFPLDDEGHETTFRYRDLKALFANWPTV